MSESQRSLAPDVRAALERVEISDDLTSAVVEGRELKEGSGHELRRELSSTFYELFHCGQAAERKVVPYHLRDGAFEKELVAGVPHRSTRVSGLVCAPAEPVPDSERILVERDGVRVWMPLSALEVDGRPEPGTTVTLDVTPMRPGLSPGHFLVDGSLGGLSARADGGPLLRVYVNLAEPHAAPRAWARVLAYLESSGVGYRAKVLSSAPLFPRRDGLVVYLPEGSWHAAPGLADAVAGIPGIGNETSMFTERMAPGVAMAWEPDDQRPKVRGFSFGQHRASVLAEALIDSARHGTPVADAATEALLEASIDPTNLARNSNSPAMPKAGVTVPAD